MTDAFEVARDFVHRRYPNARIAILGGIEVGWLKPSSTARWPSTRGSSGDVMNDVRSSTPSRRQVFRSRTMTRLAPGHEGPVTYLQQVLARLTGLTSPQEAYVILATAFRQASELALLTQRRWLGSEKWLIRHLRDAHDHGLVPWSSSQHDPQQLAVICREVLNASGGYLQDGFVRGERPSS